MKYLVILMLAVLTISYGCRQEEKTVALDKSMRLLVKINGKYGYCDRGGILVIPAQFDSAAIFSEGLAAVRVNGKNGYIDVSGKMVIPPTFNAASIFLGGRASVRKAGTWGYIDQTGKMVTDSDYLSTFGFTDGLAAVVVTKGGSAKAGFIDRKSVV